MFGILGNLLPVSLPDKTHTEHMSHTESTGRQQHGKINGCAYKDEDPFIGPREFVVGYSKAPEQPQSSARPICHSHAMTNTGHEPATKRIATYRSSPRYALCHGETLNPLTAKKILNLHQLHSNLRVYSLCLVRFPSRMHLTFFKVHCD